MKLTIAILAAAIGLWTSPAVAGPPAPAGTPPAAAAPAVGAPAPASPPPPGPASRSESGTTTSTSSAPIQVIVDEPGPDADGSPRLAAARQFMSVLNRDGQFLDNNLNLIEQTMRTNAAGQDAATLTQVNTFLRAMRAEMTANNAEYDLSMARVFARNYTEQELRDITVFARTPSGLRFFMTQSVVAADSSVAGQAFAQRLAPAIMRRVQAQTM